MAKIVTITNPLTGQPAQVDQLEHTAQEIDDAIARALPSGAIDTALQNKADTSSVYSKDESISASTRTALSLPETATPDAALAEIARQLSGTVESTDYPGCYYRTVDGVTEWLNPPMLLGVEYRTTERWNGKPVYAMTVDFGPLPNNTATYVDLPGWVSTNRAFSINIVAHSPGETDPVPLGLSTDYSSSFWFIDNPTKRLYIRSRVDLSSYTSCYVYLKYTKA